MWVPYNRLNQFRKLMANGTLHKDSGEQRVAFELMQFISGRETGAMAAERDKNPRKYHLELYAQCLRIVGGEDFEDVLEDIEQ